MTGFSTGTMNYKKEKSQMAGIFKLKSLSALSMAFLFAPLNLILCGCIAAHETARATPTPEPVYSVGALRARLAHAAPAALLGRVLHVRALAEPCPAWGSPHDPLHCTAIQPVLVDPDGADLADPLPLVVGSGSPLLAALRHLPLAGGLLPAAPAPPWEVLRTYRVRLQSATGSSCDAPLCIEAVLLDAAP